MDGTTYLGLSAQIAIRAQVDATANNVANAATAGYRADRMLFQSRVERLAVPGGRVAFVQDRATYIDRRQGPIETTGNPLDVAIDGEAFLAVRRPGAAGLAYTRDGRLKQAPDGTLVDSAGRPVVAEGGGTVVLPERATRVEVRADGNVLATVDNVVQPAGRIGLFAASRPDEARKAGDGLVEMPAASVVPAPSEGPRGVRLVQGAVEGSTVRGVVEVAALTEAQRAYERLSRMIGEDNDRQRRMIETLGRPAN